jgi:hypothetical protein
MQLRWDSLDAQSCAEDGVPDWNSMIVVGPTKIRDARGHVTLQWTVTVQCAPPAGAASGSPIPAPAVDVEPALPPSPLGTAA